MAVVNRMGVLSVGKVSGILYALFGLIAGAIFALMSLVGAGIAATESDSAGAFGALFGVGAIIFLPIVYGIIGFIGGIISAALYNLVAGMVGGIELDLR